LQNYIKFLEMTQFIEHYQAEGLNRKIPQLKTYYLSKAGFFNASGKIFEDNDYDAIVGIIQNRAKNKPDGASAKTIQHFRLG